MTFNSLRAFAIVLVWGETAAAQQALPSFRLGPPVVQFGTSSGPVDELLAGVIGATRLSNGSIAIGEGSVPRILLFTTDGKLQRSLGRDGDGPGELRQPHWLGRCESDGFAAYDPAQSRLTLFSVTGDVRQTIAVSQVAGFSPLLSCLPTSQFFLLGSSGVTNIAPGTTSGVPTVLARVRSPAVDTISPNVGEQEYYVNRARNGFTPVPLGRMVLGSSGTSRLFICTSKDGRCTVFDTAGIEKGRFSVNLRRQSVSVQDWGRARSRMLESAPRAQTLKLRTLVLEEIQKPSEFPLIDQIKADSKDRLWVRTFEGYGTELATWIMVLPGGRPLARAILPSAMRLLEVGNDYLLGLSRDADGAESVGLYRYKLPS